MPYSVTIREILTLAILSWGLTKTMRDRIVHHLTQVLPANPDQHLTERTMPSAEMFACPLTLEDDRAGREGLHVYFRFAVLRNDVARTLVVYSGHMREEQPEGEEFDDDDGIPEED
jgi:hypothetical protein